MEVRVVRNLDLGIAFGRNLALQAYIGSVDFGSERTCVGACFLLRDLG